MVIVIHTKNEKTVEDIKRLDGIEKISCFEDGEIVFKRQVPVYTPEQLVEKIKKEEKENEKDC